MPNGIIVNEKVKTDLLTSDFDYELPEGLIAQTPAERRDGSRLMILDRKKDAPEEVSRAFSCKKSNKSFTCEKIFNCKTSFVPFKNLPNKSVSQKANGTMDKIKKNTSMPATVVYFFSARKAKRALTPLYNFLIVSTTSVCAKNDRFLHQSVVSPPHLRFK